MISPGVLIAIEDPARRERCFELLQKDEGIRIVEVVSDAQQLVEAVRYSEPQVVLLDTTLLAPNEPGFLPALLLSSSPQARILLLSAGAPRDLLLDALAAGVRGFLEDDEWDRLLARAVQKVDEGEAWVPRKMVASLLDRLTELSRPHGGRPHLRSADISA
jgi:DNA-binding NarL/FixJ family response regulator